MKWRKSAMATAVACLALSLVACGPGSAAPSSENKDLGPVSKDVKGAGQVTLTVWDQNTEGAMPEVQEKLNADFHAKYPNVTIKRTAQSFKDLKTTLKLALSSNNPPDVIQANQGYPDMGAFVQAGMLRPLNDYEKLYKWDSYYPKNLLAFNSFSKNGKTWQGDQLFGVSQTGELIGFFYNKSSLSNLGMQVPKDLNDVEKAMAAAKKAGILPLSYGDLEKSPGIQLLGVLQASYGGSKYVNNLVNGRSGSWTDEQTVKAAQTALDWQKKGYLTSGANGVSRDTAISDFGDGKALFTIQGNWQEQAMKQKMGDNVGFFTLNSLADHKPATTGGEGLAWAMTSKTKHADVAAAYIDFVTNKDSAKQLLQSNSMPTVLPADYTPEAGSLKGDIVAEYKRVQGANGVVPYLDYTTSTAYDTIAASMQDLIAEKMTVKQFTEKIQDNYSTFLAGRH